MKISNKIKLGILGSLTTLLVLDPVFQGCESKEKQHMEKIQPAESKSYSKDTYNYPHVDWILSKKESKLIHGYNQNRENLPKSLEEIVFREADPKKINLTEWEITSLARLIPIKLLIEKHAHYYSIDPMWATMFLNFESAHNPADFNKKSNDFGLGQIKRKSERLAKELGTNVNGKFYSPYLDSKKNIFEPETNIIMSMILHRYNIDEYNLNNSDQAYAIYVRGKLGLTPDGKLNGSSINKIKGLHDRYDYYKNIIPLFRLKKEEIESISNKDTRKLLKMYNENKNTNNIKEIYKKELDYFLNDLEKNINGDARSVLVYDDCVVFAKTLNVAFGINQADNYRRLKNVGYKLKKVVKENWLKTRVNKTTESLSNTNL